VLAAGLEDLGRLRQAHAYNLCVVDYYEGPTNPCDWLEYDPARHVAWLKGSAPGELAGPGHRHEDAPLRVSPEKFQQLVERQSAALVPSHEATLLPLTRQLAAELLRLIPTSAKVEAVIFMAHFPRPGQPVHAGLILHALAGELRALRLAHLTEEARRLVAQISRHKSSQPLTSIEIKIAAEGQTTTQFGTAPPLSAEELEARLLPGPGVPSRRPIAPSVAARVTPSPTAGRAGCGAALSGLGFSRRLQLSQRGQFGNVAHDDRFRTDHAVMVPASPISHLQARFAHGDAMPGVGLAVVGFPCDVDGDLADQ